MATKQQIAANRRNAKKSTGPATPQGKAASSLNALRHGLRARTAVLPNENREDFDQLHDALQDHYKPQNPAEQLLVDQAAMAQWKLARTETYEGLAYDEAANAMAHAAVLDRFSQISGRFERAFLRAHRELERLKAAREKQIEKQTEKPKTSKQDDEMPPNLLVTFRTDPDSPGEVLLHRQDGVNLPLPPKPSPDSSRDSSRPPGWPVFSQMPE